MNLKIKISTCLDKWGILNILAKQSQSKITILMYHRVNKKDFEKQLIFLKKYHTIISEEVLEKHFSKNIPLPPKPLVITFDDGYLNTYTQAYPVLKKYSTPAILFIATKFIGTKKISWYDLVEYYHSNKYDFEKEMYKLISITDKKRIQLIKKYIQPKILPSKYRFMNWKQINEIKNIISLGGHTHSHPICTQTTHLTEELKKSNNLIKSKTKKVPISFCYPNGIYNLKSKNTVSKQYKLGFSSKFGTNTKQTNKYELKRIGIPENENISVFKLKLGCLGVLFGKLKPKRFAKLKK